MAKKKDSSSAAVESGGPNYTVLARRYRPQQFADLIGQEAVARALINAIQSNRVAHAYLFTGARGVGKTSTARILAKALNCVHGPTATPCDACEICQSIASGEDVDVLEIDGASNNKVEEVRELRQNVGFRPSRARYRIYIIDEVHMLSTAAFNALLKTLEEPPEHVKFIFATTEVQKIPVTILSRCQRFDFGGIAATRIVECLRQVVAGEGMEADDEALELIARRASGSMRDAQSLLDQLLAFGGERLTSDRVHQMLGTAHDERVMALVAAVLEHDSARALEMLGQAADEGLQLGEFLDQLLEYWRDLMLAHCAGPDFKHLNLPARHRESLGKQAKSLKLDTILAGLDVLATAKARMRGSSHARTLLEVALVRLGRLDDLVSLSQVAQWLNQPGGAAPRPNASGTPAASSVTQGRGSGPTRLSDTVSPPETVKKKLNDAPKSSADPPLMALTSETLPKIWQEVMRQAGQFLGSDLSKAELPAIFGPNTLVLRFPGSYNSERENCLRQSSVKKVEDALRKITGHACSVRIESSGGDQAPVRAAAALETATQSSLRQQQSQALQEPLIKRAIEVLDAQFVGAPDEGFGSVAAPTAERADFSDIEET